MSSSNKAILACGCFWGVEYLFQNTEGVTSTSVGYTGGHTDDPGYRAVCSGSTGHVEAVEVEFDPNIISYRDILRHFFKIHDPTQENGQGPDIGSQYLSVIFYLDEEQKSIAEDLMKEIEEKNIFEKPLATKLEAFKKYYIAEDNHQNYLNNNPTGHMCHFYRDLPF